MRSALPKGRISSRTEAIAADFSFPNFTASLFRFSFSVHSSSSGKATQQLSRNSRPKVIVILAIRPCASVTSFSKYQQCGISGGTITTSPLPKGSVRSPISRMPEPTMIYDNSHVACSCRPICSPGARHTSSKVKEVFSGRGTALSFIIWVKYLPEGE